MPHRSRLPEPAVPARPISSRRVVAALLAAAALLVTGCGGAKRPAAAPTTPPTSPSTSPSTATSTTTTTTTVPIAHPPYPVVRVVLPLVDRTRPTVSRGHVVSASRALTTYVWYPKAPGRWPLVVFAHGFDVSPSPYVSLLTDWARQGFVVAAPAFPLTDPDVAGANLDENDINNQPDDVRFVTDQLVAASSPVAARIDASRVAVAGHSDGGETALAAAVAPAPANQPRYRAVIAMSVQPLTDGGTMANPPILVTQGDADAINPPALGQQTYAAARPPTFYLDLHGGGHLPPLEAGSPWLTGVEAVTLAFLDGFVAGTTPVTGIKVAAGRYADLTLQSA